MWWSASVDVVSVARRTAGWSGADLLQLCQTAAYQTLQRRGDLHNSGPVEMVDFELALKQLMLNQ